MNWLKIVEYKASLVVDDEVFRIVVRKEGDDDCFSVDINGMYIAECGEFPTREFLEQIIREDEQIEDMINRSSFRVS